MFVLVEAYREEASPDNQDFGRQGLPDLTVQQVTVNTYDPIPVYEEISD